MYVLLRFIVSSFDSLVRFFHSFSVKLDVKRAFLAYGFKNDLYPRVALLTCEKFLLYCGTKRPDTEEVLQRPGP